MADRNGSLQWPNGLGESFNAGCTESVYVSLRDIASLCYIRETENVGGAEKNDRHLSWIHRLALFRFELFSRKFDNCLVEEAACRPVQKYIDTKGIKGLSKGYKEENCEELRFLQTTFKGLKTLVGHRGICGGHQRQS